MTFICLLMFPQHLQASAIRPGPALCSSLKFCLDCLLIHLPQSQEASGIHASDLDLKRQNFPLACLSMDPGTPQEHIMGRVIARYLTIFKVLLLHLHMGQEFSGLPIDVLLPPGIHPNQTQRFPGILLRGTNTRQDDGPQGYHQQTNLVHGLLMIHHPINSEV